ncbi:protein-domain-containing protein [Cunninghamella echinulata]|nr:protein-domain-containing protein [Cunninghamella echinulata]
MDTLGTISKLYELDPIDQEDELDLELYRCHSQYYNDIQDKTELELQNYLQEKASESKKGYADIVSALLYGVLTEPEAARQHFHCISIVNRDQYAMVLNRTFPLISSIKFSNLLQRTKDQIIWLFNELTCLNVPNMEGFYLYLLRQIKAGDNSPPNMRLCEQIIKLLEAHKTWLDSYPRLIATSVYTFLRLIAEHRQIQHTALQQKEIRFVINILRQKWMICCSIGRDLIRALQDVYYLPDFQTLWDDLLKQPQKFSQKFQGIESLLKTPTPKEFLRARLTPDVEHRLMFILQYLRINQFQRNLGWFIQRYLSTSESEPFYVDVIRFIVAGWYPNNQILQSDIVPRYVIIGSMIRTIKSHVVAANVKTALIFDWLFFTPTDNIMFIEPAMLLMERSVERYPYITATLLEFIYHSINEYYPPLKDYMAKSVLCGMQTMLSKCVIRSLLPIYNYPAIDDHTKDIMTKLFGEFLQQESQQQQLPSQTNSTIDQPSTTTSKIQLGTSQLNEKVENISKEKQSNEDQDDTDKYLYGDIEETNINIKNDQVNQIEDQAPNSTDNVSTIESRNVLDNAIDTSEVNISAQNMDTNIMDDEEMDVISDATKITDVMSQQQQQKQQQKEEQTDVYKEDSDSDYPDEEMEDNESSEAMQSNQSYWIFGDALARFKTACKFTQLESFDIDDEEFGLQLIIAKRSLKEILAVFLRMSISAETLLPNIANPILKLASQLILVNSHSVYKPDASEEDIIMDNTKDPLDLLFIVYWQMKDNAASSEKILQLIGYLSHNYRTGKKHIVGMRWWLFIAGQLKLSIYTINEPYTWIPLISNSYKEFVLQGYKPSDEIDEPAYLGQYLLKDIKYLAKYNIESFYKVLPIIYRHFTSVSVGNTGFLNLISTMSLPAQIGNLVCILQFGTIRVFGTSFDIKYIESSFEKKDIYEISTICQLLAAEIQGNSDLKIQLSNSDFLLPLKHDFRSDTIPYLLAILSNIVPTENLLISLLQITIGKSSTKVETDIESSRFIPAVQFSLAVFKNWHQRYPENFITVLNEWVSNALEEMELSEDYFDSDVKQLGCQLVFLIRLWWTEMEQQQYVQSALSLDIFMNNKPFMNKLSKLANQVSEPWPKEWHRDIGGTTRKKVKKVLESDEDDDE